jgi:hypothetical protein|tara:strand:+ start:67 stop:435 length:369 start_codon:yes stop_codon:yes gene_type:complete
MRYSGITKTEETMPLTSDYRKVNTEGWSQDREKQISEFCFPMLGIRMGKISDETIDEIYFRFRFLEKIGKNLFRHSLDKKELYQLLESYIGLECNISPEPRYKFIRSWIKTVENEIEPGWTQ